jgi:hypothetical protein
MYETFMQNLWLSLRHMLLGYLNKDDLAFKKSFGRLVLTASGYFQSCFLPEAKILKLFFSFRELLNAFNPFKSHSQHTKTSCSFGHSANQIFLDFCIFRCGNHFNSYWYRSLEPGS